MRRCVWSRNFKKEGALAHWGLSCPLQKPFSPHQVTPLRVIIVGSIDLCSWGNCVASKSRELVTRRRGVISRKNRILRYTTAKISHAISLYDKIKKIFNYQIILIIVYSYSNRHEMFSTLLSRSGDSRELHHSQRHLLLCGFKKENYI